jgi:hypothetical protein
MEMTLVKSLHNILENYGKIPVWGKISDKCFLLLFSINNTTAGGTVNLNDS